MKKKYLGILYIILAAFCFEMMNTFVKLSWGNDGLASASKLKYENIKPWSYLEINPTSRVMKTDKVRLDVSIGF